MITIKIDELKPSPSNVRPKHTKEDIAMMANSIKNRGIINAPSVAKNGDGRYEIIAGNLRTAGAKAAGLTEIECDDVTALSDAERVELSLSENVDRRSMTVIQEYTAFDKLFKAGRTVEEIASRFDKTVRQAQQILAIGSLPKKILASAEAGDIGDRTIRCLAIAPVADVRRYAKLPVKDRPRDWEITEWLAGNDGMYLAKHALFDLELYDGGKITDLFSEDDEVWLTDGAQFWDLQAAAYDAKLTAFTDKGWQLEQLDYWQSWAYEKTAKKNGGKVYWCKDEKSGAVEFHVGYARLNKSGAAPKPKDGKPAEKPETSQAFNDYCTELRHNAVCAEMTNVNQHGLVAVVILLLKQCDNISLRNTGGRVKSEAYINSINEQDDNLDIQDARLNMWTELGIEGGMTWDLDIAKVAKKLLACTPTTLYRYIIAIVASEWAVDGNGKDGDAIGKALGLNGVDRITLDDGFWNGITNKKTLLAIAKEHKITVSEKMTVKVLRAKVKDGVPESWLPDYLTF